MKRNRGIKGLILVGLGISLTCLGFYMMSSVTILTTTVEYLENLTPVLETGALSGVNEILQSQKRVCNGEGCLNNVDILRLSNEIVTFSKVFGFSEEKIVKILLVENPWLDSLAVSPAGAIGLMQVMPFHRGAWEGCGDKLETVSGSLCHGLSVLETYSLLRYNGCMQEYCLKYVEMVQNAY